MAGLSPRGADCSLRPDPAEERLGLALLGVGAGACVLGVMTGSMLIAIACVMIFSASLWLQARHLIHPGVIMAVLALAALAVPARFVVSFLYFPLTLTIGLALAIAWLGQRLVVRHKLARTDLLIFAMLAAAVLSQAFGLLPRPDAGRDGGCESSADRAPGHERGRSVHRRLRPIPCRDRTDPARRRGRRRHRRCRRVGAVGHGRRLHRVAVDPGARPQPCGRRRTVADLPPGQTSHGSTGRRCTRSSSA